MTAVCHADASHRPSPLRSGAAKGGQLITGVVVKLLCCKFCCHTLQNLLSRYKETPASFPPPKGAVSVV